MRLLDKAFYIVRFWFKTIEFGDNTIKSVGDLKSNFGFSSIIFKFQYLVMDASLKKEKLPGLPGFIFPIRILGYTE